MVHNFTQIQVEEGFCKSQGEARSPEEAYVVFNLGLYPEAVRKGEYPMSEATIEKPTKGDDNKPTNTETTEASLEDLQKLYEEKFGKVPNNKKNDKDRLSEKLFN